MYESQMQHLLRFDSLDQNLLDSNTKSFAFYLLAYKISWISLATMSLVYAPPLTSPPIFAGAGSIRSLDPDDKEPNESQRILMEGQSDVRYFGSRPPKYKSF
jgi:hypothetical protein